MRCTHLLRYRSNSLISLVAGLLLMTLTAGQGVAATAAETTQALIQIQAVLKQSRLELGADHTRVADQLNRLGTLQFQLGRFQEALASYSEALLIKQRSHGLTHASVGDLHYRIGIVHHKQGQYAAALSAYEQALPMMRQSLGVAHAQVVGLEKIIPALQQVAGIHNQASQKAKVAATVEEIKTRAAEKAEAVKTVMVPSKEATQVVQSVVAAKPAEEKLNAVSSAAQQVPSETAPSKEKVKQSPTKPIDAASSPKVAQKSVIPLDEERHKSTPAAQKSVYESAPAASKKEERGRELAKGDQQDPLKAYLLTPELERAFHAARLLAGSDKPSEALKSYRSLLDQTKANYGNKHPIVAIVLFEMGRLNQKLYRKKDAMLMLDTALPIMQEKMADHPLLIAEVHNRLGSVNSELGFQEEALIAYRRALHLLTKRVGEKHILFAQALHNLGNVYTLQDRIAEALEVYSQSLPIKKQLLGTEHTSVAMTLNSMGASYARMARNVTLPWSLRKERYSKALGLYNQAADIYQKQLGKQHVTVGEVLNNKGNVYRRLGQNSEALKLYKRAFNIMQERLDKKHTNLAHIMTNMADIYLQKPEQKAHGCGLLQQSLNIAQTKFSYTHPLVQRIQGLNLTYCQAVSKKGS
uniref:Uncharacterized protein n=1 Tax=Magnetococcus massalia (strain MO-1) TaxID=451514 RepID=A0A1S7LEU7_MAGMO|nr:exported protein of unknown function. Tetratricopeptide repeat [Candidatus Magnetococcus massalia]